LVPGYWLEVFFSYNFIGGIEKTFDHIRAACDFALGIKEIIETMNSEKISGESEKLFPLQIKIGIANGGPVVTGFLGNEKNGIQFDIFGDVVEQVMEIQRNCNPGDILVNELVFATAEEKFNFSEDTQDVEYKDENIRCSVLLKNNY
jgi:class 3 adenylate cyclase